MTNEILAKYLISLAINENVLKDEIRSVEFNEFAKHFLKKLFLGSISSNKINELVTSIVKEFSHNNLRNHAQLLLRDLKGNMDNITQFIIDIIDNFVRAISKETITSLEVLKSGNYKLFSDLYITPYICSALEIGCRAKAPARLYDIERTEHAIVLRSDCIPISRLLHFIFGDISRFIPHARGIDHSGFYEIAIIPRILLRSEVINILKNKYLKLMSKEPMTSIKVSDVKRYIEKSFDLVTELIISGPCLNTKGIEFLLSIINDLEKQGSWIYVIHRGCSPTDLVCNRKHWISCIEAEEYLINRDIEVCFSQDVIETNLVINREVVISGNGNILSGENFPLYIIGDKVYAEEMVSKLLRPCICSSDLLQSPIYLEKH